jgi:hypothetical protein
MHALFSKVCWPLLALPLLLTVLVAPAVRLMLTTGIDFKALFENVALWVLFVAVAIGSIRYLVERRPALLWLMAFCAVLLFRELHLMKQASAIAIVAMAVLLLVAWQRFDRLAGCLATPRVVTLLAMMICCYALSQVMDRNFIRGISPVFVVLEEIVEDTGHFLGVVLMLVAKQDSEPDCPEVR